MHHYVVMGVSGCGKSSVASALADHFNATMIEADELHGPANVAKMARGDALTDDDRWPWLLRVAQAMKGSQGPVFVSCSALRRVYRDFLVEHSGVKIGFIHLHAEQDVIAARMSKRKSHFMPLSLLESQFQALESLEIDEIGVVVDITQSLEGVVNDACSYVNHSRT